MAGGRIQTVVERTNLTVRAHGKIMRQVNQLTAERHAKRRVGKHFQRNAETSPGGAYHYRNRSKQTKAKKRKLGVDPQRPNYQTGKMLAHMKSRSQITRTQHKWTWKSRAPFPLADYRRRELEAITRGEISADTDFMERTYVRLANQPGVARRRRSKRG